MIIIGAIIKRAVFIIRLGRKFRFIKRFDIAVSEFVIAIKTNAKCLRGKAKNSCVIEVDKQSVCG